MQEGVREREGGGCGEGGRDEGVEREGGGCESVGRREGGGGQGTDYLPPALRALIALVWVAYWWVTRGTFSDAVSSFSASVDILRLHPVVGYRPTRCGQIEQCSYTSRALIAHILP